MIGRTFSQGHDRLYLPRTCHFTGAGIPFAVDGVDLGPSSAAGRRGLAGKPLRARSESPSDGALSNTDRAHSFTARLRVEL